MNLIIYIMKHIKFKHDEQFKFFLDFHCDINVSDIELYKYYIQNIHINNTFYQNSNHIIDIYNKSKFVKNSFKKLVFFWRFKKKFIKFDNQVDLYFNPLSNLKPYLKITILQNNTIYYFRISDLINLWVDSLSKSENLFCIPAQLKNPYTNIVFKKHNLYNIFFAIYFSSYNVPEIIYRFFKTDLIIDLYMLTYYPIIKEYAIDTYFENSTIAEQYDQISNMINTMNNEITDNFFYIPDNPSFNRKKFFVRELRFILKYYLRGTYSCNPLRKKVSFDRCICLIKLYNKNNPNIISRDTTRRSSLRLRSNNQSPLSNLPAIPNTFYDYSEVVSSPSSSSLGNHSPSNAPTVRTMSQINNLFSLPQTDPVIEINIPNIPNIPISNNENDNYVHHDDIIISDIDSNDDNFSDFTDISSPFSATNELPRTPTPTPTPTHNNNTGGYYNSFQLFPNHSHK